MGGLVYGLCKWFPENTERGEKCPEFFLFFRPDKNHGRKLEYFRVD
jgi:hypothetical protein